MPLLWARFREFKIGKSWKIYDREKVSYDDKNIYNVLLSTQNWVTPCVSWFTYFKYWWNLFRWWTKYRSVSREHRRGFILYIRPLIPTMYIGPNAGGVMNYKVWQYKMRKLLMISWQLNTSKNRIKDSKNIVEIWSCT